MTQKRQRSRLLQHSERALGTFGRSAEVFSGAVIDSRFYEDQSFRSLQAAPDRPCIPDKGERRIQMLAEIISTPGLAMLDGRSQLFDGCAYRRNRRQESRKANPYGQPNSCTHLFDARPSAPPINDHYRCMIQRNRGAGRLDFFSTLSDTLPNRPDPARTDG